MADIYVEGMGYVEDPYNVIDSVEPQYVYKLNNFEWCNNYLPEICKAPDWQHELFFQEPYILHQAEVCLGVTREFLTDLDETQTDDEGNSVLMYVVFCTHLDNPLKTHVFSGIQVFAIRSNDSDVHFRMPLNMSERVTEKAVTEISQRLKLSPEYTAEFHTAYQQLLKYLQKPVVRDELELVVDSTETFEIHQKFLGGTTIIQLTSNQNQITLQ